MPSLVKFEIDCGWMVFAGKNPVDYFKKYPNRIPLIHVKDFEKRAGNETDMRGAELGTGVGRLPADLQGRRTGGTASIISSSRKVRSRA